MTSYFSHAVLPFGQTSGTCTFSVWCTKSTSVELILYNSSESYKSGTVTKSIPMNAVGRNWFEVQADVESDWLYMFRLSDGKQYPDPRSSSQSLGVHGPSGIRIAPESNLIPDSWHGIETDKLIIYELHPAAFIGRETEVVGEKVRSEEGGVRSDAKRSSVGIKNNEFTNPCGSTSTPHSSLLTPHYASYWSALTSKLPYIQNLGVTAIELTPIAESVGLSWGYDGVYPYAPTRVYGTADELRTFIRSAHEYGLAVILDVVYNHFGPEGCYIGFLGDYYDSRYKNPWGEAINYCGENSDAVRQYVTENAQYWIREFGFDGLRLDATDTITDFAGHHILADIAYAVHKQGKEENRITFVTAEDDDNYRIKIDSPQRNGYGLDGVWNIDFHHALHALVTGERDGLYQDFCVSDRFSTPAEALLKAFTDGWIYDGFYRNRYKKTWGTNFDYLSPTSLIVYNQNHDQAGNCAESKRLGTTISPEKARFVAALTILSPFTPLLFMGEEYGEPNPFPFFTTFEDEGLKRAVRRGRQRDMDFMHQCKLPKVADPFARETFEQASLSWTSDVYETRLQLYKDLIALRKQTGIAGQSFKPYAQSNGAGLIYLNNQPSILTWRWTARNESGTRLDDKTYIVAANVTDKPVPVPPDFFENVLLTTESAIYGGQRLKGGNEAKRNYAFDAVETNSSDDSTVLFPFEVVVRKR